ncbi:MAG TPA: hypothetical protein VIV58_27180 [Kofleriaceae bacterium]
MRALAIGLVVATAVASAEPADPKQLAPIAVAHAKGTGDPTAVYAAGVEPDVLLFALAGDGFAALADGAPIDGKLGDRDSIPASSAFDAIAPATTIRLPRARTGRAVDIELRGAGTLEVLRFLADSAGASYVFAPLHALPHITVRAKHVDPRATATAIAKLAGLELVVRAHAWIVTEPGAALDAKLVAHTDGHTRIEIDHAHPGEARRLIEPAVGQDRNPCPKDAWIDASLHGEIGALEAVLATIRGPACEQQPNLAELDTATAQLVGIMVGPKLRRAVFRVPHGARAFEPSGGDQRVEVDYVIVKAGDTTALHAGAPIAGSAYVAPGPFESPDPTAWQLRGTVRVGTSWRAIFRSKTEWRVLGAPVEITAGSARSSIDGKPRGYTLEH